MSFMQGFGSAFERSFQAGIERKERRKDDTFKLMYTSFMDNLKERRKFETEDRQTVNKAKSLTEGLDVPEGAWVKAYEWLRSGLDDETVVERLSTGTFTPSELPAGEVSKDTEAVRQTREAMAPTDTESREDPTMTAQPASTQGPVSRAKPTTTQAPQAPQAPKRKGPMAGLLQKPGLFDSQEDDMEDGYKRIAEIAGLSPEEVREIAKGAPGTPSVDTSSAPKFTAQPKAPKLPDLDQAIHMRDNARSEEELELAESQINSITQAMAIQQMYRGRADNQQDKKLRITNPDGSVRFGVGRVDVATGRYVDPNTGEPLNAVPVDDNELKALNDIAADSLSDTAMEYKQKQNAVISMYRIGGEQAALIEQYPQLQQKAVAGAVQSGQRFLAEFITGRETLRDIFKGKTNFVEDTLKKVGQGGDVSAEDGQRLSLLEKELNQYLGQNANDLAAAKQLFDTRAAIMAYQLAAAQGQYGRHLQEKEREMFMRLAEGGITPEKFMENMGGLLAGMRTDLEQQSSALREHNGKIQLFKQMYGYSPPIDVVPTMEEVVSTVSDPMTQRGIEAFERYAPANSRLFNTYGQDRQRQQPQAPQAPQAQPQGMRAVGKTQDGRVIYEDQNGSRFVR